MTTAPTARFSDHRSGGARFLQVQWSDQHCLSLQQSWFQQSLQSDHQQQLQLPEVASDAISSSSELPGGRAPARIVESEGIRLVLKQYRRGGLVRHANTEQYLWTGFERTRAVREVRLLARLFESGFPVPRPIACRVEQSHLPASKPGFFYRAWLLTELLPECRSLDQLLSSDEDQTNLNPDWHYIGGELARFREANVYHADLNISNILFDAKGQLYLIDFDRGRELQPQGKHNKKLQQRMLQRLLRSIDKLERRYSGVSVSRLDRDKLQSAFWSQGVA